MDIAPKYAGTLFGVSNMVGSLAGTSPSLAGVIRKNVAVRIERYIKYS